MTWLWRRLSEPPSFDEIRSRELMSTTLNVQLSSVAAGLSDVTDRLADRVTQLQEGTDAG